MPLAQQVLIECKDQYKAFQRMQRLRQIFTKPKEGADIEAQVGHHFQIQVPKILGLLLRSVCTEGEKKAAVEWRGQLYPVAQGNLCKMLYRPSGAVTIWYLGYSQLLFQTDLKLPVFVISAWKM